MEWCADANGNAYLCDCSDPNAPDYPCGSAGGAGGGPTAGYGGDPLPGVQASTGQPGALDLRGCDALCEPCPSLFTYASCWASCMSGGQVGNICGKGGQDPIVRCQDIGICPPSPTMLVVLGLVAIGVLVAAQRAGL